MVSVLVSSAVDCGFIGGVMVSVLVSSAVDCGFEPRSGQTKVYEIGICCFSIKHTALKKKSKYCWLFIEIMCQEWSDMSTHRLVSVN